eukprot:6206069-Pleurochrysis_carterae.AAC.1
MLGGNDAHVLARHSLGSCCCEAPKLEPRSPHSQKRFLRAYVSVACPLKGSQHVKTHKLTLLFPLSAAPLLTPPSLFCLPSPSSLQLLAR